MVKKKNAKGLEAENHIPVGCLSRLRKDYHTFRPAEKRVVDYILENGEKVVYSTITELSANSKTSDATIIRLCRLIGYNGYQELKIALARELVSPVKDIHEDINPSDDFNVAIRKAFQANIQAISDTSEIFDLEALEKAVASITKARQVYVYGMGTSGLSAQDLCYKLLRIGIHADYYADSHMQNISTALLTEQDVVVGISHSGSTREIIEVLNLAKGKGVTVICITNHKRSPMTKLADIILYTAAEETPFGSGGMPSMMAQLSIVDAIFVGVTLKTYDKAITFIESTGETVKSKKI